VARFGTALICVRYRYDERTGDNLTTAELIVDRRPRLTSRYRDRDMVAVAVPYTETALREKLKAAGGRWNPEERVWRVCFGAIRGDSTLVERIVRE
jgi:hypothetical protein